MNEPQVTVYETFETFLDLYTIAKLSLIDTEDTPVVAIEDIIEILGPDAEDCLKYLVMHVGYIIRWFHPKTAVITLSSLGYDLIEGTANKEERRARVVADMQTIKTPLRRTSNLPK